MRNSGSPPHVEPIFEQVLEARPAAAGRHPCLVHPMRAGGAEQGIELRAPIIALGGPRIASCPRAHERDVSKRLQRPFGLELGPMVERSEERSVGKEWVSKGRFRWAP